jgi:hypothetical protein
MFQVRWRSLDREYPMKETIKRTELMNDQSSARTRRPWHAPELRLLELVSTGNTTLTVHPDGTMSHKS